MWVHFNWWKASQSSLMPFHWKSDQAPFPTWLATSSVSHLLPSKEEVETISTRMKRVSAVWWSGRWKSVPLDFVSLPPFPSFQSKNLVLWLLWVFGFLFQFIFKVWFKFGICLRLLTFISGGVFWSSMTWVLIDRQVAMEIAVTAETKALSRTFPLSGKGLWDILKIV